MLYKISFLVSSYAGFILDCFRNVRNFYFQYDQAFGMITYIESVILAKPMDNNAKNIEFMKTCQNKLRLV